MPNLSQSEIEKPDNNVTDNNEEMNQSKNTIDLSNDPDFPKLIECYQRAEFDRCDEVLTKLERLYPDDPRLSKFKDDLQMQLSLKTMAVSNKKAQKNTRRKITFKMSVFAVITTILVMVAYFVAYNVIQNNARTKQMQLQQEQLISLNDQAEQLLRAGQPQRAAEIIGSITAIDPAYVNLPDLTLRTTDLLRLEAKYKAAQTLIEENKSSEGLGILKEIEAENPGLWDVRQQIVSIETSIQIAKFLQEGNAAYAVENWDQVITSYEQALTLAPKLDDPLMKEQLLKGYLNKMISMLQNESTSIDDIENAEQYYRRAVAMIPQSRAFASERGNLQEVSSDLLVFKFSQTAKAILEDKNQTVTSIAKAVTYMSKAANLKPKNTALQSDLKNAEYYQIGFQNFIEMNWVFAITNLKQVLAVESNYANGNANLLLFEAYYALGKQFQALELYQDARKNLEEAEILAWSDSGNLMKMLRVQIELGNTIGKTKDYKNAISYYKFALDAIKIYDPRLALSPALYWKLKEAENWAMVGNYETSYPLYQDFLKEISSIYTVKEVEIGDGVCLAFFASENSSIVDAIVEANNLPKSMVITFGRNLKVPSIKN